MLKAYKYRIYPTVEQANQMEQHFGACRLVWNLALSAKTQAYESNRINISRFDLQTQLLGLKKEYAWLREVNSQSLQCVLLHLDKAYKTFFSGGGFPKYKSKCYAQSFACSGNTRRIDFQRGLLTVPKIKNIQIVISKRFTGVIKTVTIRRETAGKYYASILVDDGKSLPSKKKISQESTVGVDLGLKDFAIMSDGATIGNPKFLKSSLKRLKCLQRRLSRKKKGSNRRQKAKLKVALHHEKIRFQRQDFLHKLSSAITKQYDTICVEDLAVSNMVRNRRLSQAISDVGWGEFLRQLKYKCEWNGKNLLIAPRFFASSKTCGECQAINETLTLQDREWTCANCGAAHDRDLNAAKNLKQYFLNHSGEGISGEPVELLPIGRAKKREI